MFGGEYTRSIALIGLHESIESNGLDAEQIFIDNQLNDILKSYNDTFHISSQINDCILLAVEKTQNENFTLEWAQSLKPYFPNLGSASCLTFEHENVEQWLNAIIEYQNVQTYSQSLELAFTQEDKEEDISLIFKGFDKQPSTITTHYMASLKMLIDQICGSKESIIKQVNFSYPRPKSIEIYYEVFGENVQFECQRNEIIFNPDGLQVHINKSKEHLEGAIEQYIAARMHLHPRKNLISMKSTLKVILLRVMGTRRTTLNTMAGSLSVSPKKLQRLLADEGTSFSETLDEVRQDLARSMLTKTTIPIRHIAHVLDYASSPPFTLACRRWTGIAPKVFRQLNSVV
ncbi:MAG: helix-turn-helix domain-containing protein [Nitratireductor sp.]